MIWPSETVAGMRQTWNPSQPKKTAPPTGTVEHKRQPSTKRRHVSRRAERRFVRSFEAEVKA